MPTFECRSKRRGSHNTCRASLAGWANSGATMHDSRLDDEEGRIAALRRYEALETGDEKPFQRVVELVQTVLGVPAAAITLVDGERQWYKAVRGLSATSIPRADAFCDETIRQSGPLAVTDTHLDR